MLIVEKLHVLLLFIDYQVPFRSAFLKTLMYACQVWVDVFHGPNSDYMLDFGPTQTLCEVLGMQSRLPSHSRKRQSQMHSCILAK